MMNIISSAPVPENDFLYSFNLISRRLILQIKAAIRTVNPREPKYLEQDQKFKVSVSLKILNENENYEQQKDPMV